MEILLLLFLFLLSFPVHAQVVINEFSVQPTQTVELVNIATQSADISNWYLDDSGGTTYVTIPLGTVLPPQRCMVFVNDFNFNKSSADSVRLFSNAGPPTTSSAILIDSYSYAKVPVNSLSRLPDGGSSWAETAQSFGLWNSSGAACLPPPTPTLSPTLTPTGEPSPTVAASPTPTPEPTVLPDYGNILLSEVCPYPAPGEKEWVELYNGNTGEVTLANWFIDDTAGSGSSPKKISLTIPAQSYATVELSSAMLNNAGDTVRLLNAQSEEKDSMEYSNAVKQKSFGLISIDEEEYCLQSPSPNTANAPCDETATPSPSSSPVSVPTSPRVLIQKTTQGVAPPSSVTSPQTNPSTLNSQESSPASSQPDILGVTTAQPHTPSPYLSFVSLSYSLLTIFGVFIKMRHA